MAAKAPAPLQCDWSQSWAATKLPISEYTVAMQNLLKPRMVSVTNLLKGQSVDSNSSHVRIDINQIFIQRYTELFVFLLLSLVFEIIVTAVNDVKKFLCFFNFSNFSCQYREWYHWRPPPFCSCIINRNNRHLLENLMTVLVLTLCKILLLISWNSKQKHRF